MVTTQDKELEKILENLANERIVKVTKEGLALGALYGVSYYVGSNIFDANSNLSLFENMVVFSLFGAGLCCSIGLVAKYIPKIYNKASEYISRDNNHN